MSPTNEPNEPPEPPTSSALVPRPAEDQQLSEQLPLALVMAVGTRGTGEPGEESSGRGEFGRSVHSPTGFRTKI